MFNPHIYAWIKKRAKYYQKDIPSNFEEILLKYKHISKPSEDSLVFSRYYSNSKYVSATAMVKNMIIFNAEWATRIVLFDSEETMNAFKATVGHELTHKEKEIKTINRDYRTHIFLSRVNEVHADFGAVPKMLNNNRQLAIDACQYKKSLKKVDKSNNLSDHPSWEQRLDYISDFNFDKTLIFKIAEDMDFNKTPVIEAAVDFYDNIILP